MDGARTIRVSEITFIPDEQLLEQLLVDSLEETVGKGGVCACRLLTSTPSSSLHSSEAKLSADVEIKSAELASDLHKLAKAGLLMFWSAPLAVHLLQHSILSSPNVHNDRALTGPKSMQNSVASQSKSVGDIISQPKSMKNYIVPEPKSIREEIVSESKCKQCCILSEPKSMQKDISSGTKAPQKDSISSGLKSMQNETISGTKAPQKDILMSGLKSMHNEKDFMTSGSKSIHKDIISGINAPQKDVIMSGSKSMQTLILPETKSTPKELLAGPQYMHNCTPTETKSMQKHSVSGPKSTQNYNIVVERKPAQKDTISLPRSRQNDSIQGPNSTQMSSFEGLNLHMGCQTSENTFFVSCSRTGVNAEFEFAIKRISLYLKECSREYKMVFTYGNIRYIHRGVVRDRDNQLLILRMRHAPRIYHMCSGSANDQMSKNFKKIQWVRTTDFTESCSIGHSSSLGLELSKGISVSQIQENFAHYKEIEDKVLLEHGSPFLSTSKLVPILKPPEGLHLPYSVIFKINSLVQNGILSWPTLGKEFFSLLQPERSHDALINQALEKLSNSGWNTCYRPAQWLQDQLKMIEKSNRHRSAGHTPLENGLMYVNSVQVTPAKIYFSGPEVNVSNRVLRHYADYTGNFLRVAFCDENFSPLHSNDLSRRMVHGVPQQHTKLYDRILHVLREGIVIGDKKFEFLAFSSSQLRESSLWMFASTDTLTADSIRKWMGNFWAIRNVAKCASRMGQSFSSSTETFDIRNEEFEYIHDVEVDRDGKQYVFSDGIGKISSSFAEQVARKCGCDNIVPSAFQIRFAGYKGMVAVDPRSSYKLSLRPSMRKYTSNNRSLDVLNWTKYRPCFLNRQIITLLSTLGVEGHHFQTLQKEAVELINQVLTSRDKALDVLQILYIGENHNVLTDMLSCGYCPRSEPYLSMMLQAFRASKFVELRNKARIFVPKGRCLMGCLDETRTLNYGEVFIQIRDAPGNKQQRSAGQDLPCIMEGKVVVAKNPCLHPGDIRILLAVNTPKLQHMVDCIVFPQQGKRPHPSECSGSDLDGDVYFVSWDKSLIPPRQEPPMDYVAKPLKQLDREVTMEEIQEHFANYMVNDSLGVIANSHMAFADQEREMARSSKCLRLAELHSTAVDFAKTGVPVQVPVDLFPKKYPDFMEKEDKESYESTSILGKLYRYVTQADIARPNIAEKTYYDHELEVAGFDRYLDEASRYKSQYDSRLVTLMDHYGIRNEADIISGNIASLSNFVGSNKRKGDIRETIMSAVKSLKQEARRWFDSDTGKQFDKASAWYYVTYHPSYRGERNSHVPYDNSGHLISFPWVVHDILLRIKRRGHQATDYPESSAVRENRKSHSSFII
jgi:RNA-dependent RNA polymerase